MVSFSSGNGSFGWLIHQGGLLRDRRVRLDLANAHLACYPAPSDICIAVPGKVSAAISPVPWQGQVPQSEVSSGMSAESRAASYYRLGCESFP